MNSKPATKQDIADAIDELGIMMKNTFDHYEKRIDKRFSAQDIWIDRRFAEQDKRIDKKFAEQDKRIDKKFAEQKNVLMTYIDQKTDETKRYFDVVAKNIHQDLAGANEDEIIFIKNKQLNHEQRLTEVERRVALR